jgi:hypothetical protein
MIMIIIISWELLWEGLRREIFNSRHGYCISCEASIYRGLMGAEEQHCIHVGDEYNNNVYTMRRITRLTS